MTPIPGIIIDGFEYVNGAPVDPSTIPSASGSGSAVAPIIDVFTNAKAAVAASVHLTTLAKGQSEYLIKQGGNYIKTEYINKGLHQYSFLLDNSADLAISAFTDQGPADAYTIEQESDQPGKKLVTVSIWPQGSPGDSIYLSIANKSIVEPQVTIFLNASEQDDIGEYSDGTHGKRTILVNKPGFDAPFNSSRNSAILNYHGDKDHFTAFLRPAVGNMPKTYRVFAQGYNSTTPQALSLGLKVYDDNGKLVSEASSSFNADLNDNRNNVPMMASTLVTVDKPGNYVFEVNGGANSGRGQFGISVEEVTSDRIDYLTAPERPDGLHIASRYVGNLVHNHPAVVFVNEAFKRAIKYWSNAIQSDTGGNGRFLGKIWRWNDADSNWTGDPSLGPFGFATPRNKGGFVSPSILFDRNIDRAIYWTIDDMAHRPAGVVATTTTWDLSNELSFTTGEPRRHPGSFGILINEKLVNSSISLDNSTRSADRDNLTGILIHEIGHGLFLNDFSLGYSKLVKDGAFYGTNAMRYYALAKGTYPLIEPVPMVGNHWSEELLKNELMTPNVELKGVAGTDPVSLVSLGALQDLGYNVDYRYSQQYAL